MIVLGIDTSTSTGGAGLVNQNQLVGEYVLNIQAAHSERILPTVQRLLTDSNLSFDDLHGFAVVVGPGSFTGLRIGLATVTGFAYSLNKPIIPVTTLQALAWQQRNYPYLLCPIVDARRQEVFAQFYRSFEPVSEPINCTIEDLVERCKRYNEPIMFLGPGIDEYRENLVRYSLGIIPTHENVGLRPSTVASFGVEQFKQGNESQWDEVRLFYMRKSSAEYQTKRKKRHGS